LWGERARVRGAYFHGKKSGKCSSLSFPTEAGGSDGLLDFYEFINCNAQYRRLCLSHPLRARGGKDILKNHHSKPKGYKQVCEGRKMKAVFLDDEEKGLSESYERGEWTPVKNRKKEIKKLKAYARNTLQKDKRINIRMSSKDLDQVQVLAAQEGVPYQTLISSIIHKYASGYLTEKKRT
jgi:predicted DNA binding CopG/RHH family protein